MSHRTVQVRHHPVSARLQRVTLAGATGRDRTAVQLCTAPQRTHWPCPTAPETGWKPSGSCARGLQQCQRVPAATSPSSHPTGPPCCAPAPQPQDEPPLAHPPLPVLTSQPLHGVSIYSGQVGDLLSTLFHFHFELDYCLPHKSSPEYLRSI